jgi:hypothetical protein
MPLLPSDFTSMVPEKDPTTGAIKTIKSGQLWSLNPGYTAVGLRVLRGNFDVGVVQV